MLTGSLTSTVSGTEWLICCTLTQKILLANFYKLSPSTDQLQRRSFELGTAYFLLALLTLYEVPTVNARVCCANISCFEKVAVFINGSTLTTDISNDV